MNIGPLLRELEDDKKITFEFAQGMLEYPPPEGFERELGDPPHLRFFEWELPEKYLGARVPPTRGVNQPSVEDVIREHFQPQDPFCMEMALEYLHLVMEQEGPFEGLIGWSEGAAVAATLLLDDFSKCELDHSTSEFKCAIFFAGSPPFTLDGKNVLLHDQYGQVIKIPTCHILGQSDAMVELAEALFNICDSSSAIAIRDEGGHRISRDPEVIKKIVDFIKQQSH